MDRIGKYEIVDILGAGAFGQVYRARDPDVDRFVAIKMVDAAGDARIAARFRAEASTTAKLVHKNIVTIHAYGEHNGNPFIVMELLEGETLAAAISNGVELSLLDRLEILVQVADGIEYAHSCNVIHRDINPSNLVRLPSGLVKIVDFGIARVIGDLNLRRTRQREGVGTVLYMAPEQFRGAEGDTLTDLFSYGAVCYELLTGEHPFAASETASMMYRISHDEPAPLSRKCPGCPGRLETIVSRALNKNRSKRYKSAADIALDLEEIIGQLKLDESRDFFEQARRTARDGRLADALALSRKALEYDTTNREIRSFRDELHLTLSNADLQTERAELLERADVLARSRRYSEAIEILETASRTDATPEITERLGQVRQRQKARREAALLIASSREELRAGRPIEALQFLDRADAADPENPELSPLRREIEIAVEEASVEQRGAAGDSRNSASSSPLSAPDGELETKPVAASRSLALNHWVPGRSLLAYLLVGIIVAISFLLLLVRRPGAKPMRNSALELRLTPVDAVVEIDGMRYSGAPLRDGRHEVKISRAGYRSLQRQVQVPASEPLVIGLDPLPTVLTLDTEPPYEEYSLDGNSVVPLVNGKATISNILPGIHTLRVFPRSGGNQVSIIEFQASTAEAPRVLRNQPSQQAVVIALSQFNGARVISSGPTGLTAKQLDREHTADGSLTSVVVQSSENEWPIAVAAPGEAPVMDIFVRTNLPSRGILVRADQNDFLIRVNGRVQSRSRLRAGTYVRLPGIAPGKYEVVVERDGFRPEPASAEVVVNDKTDARLDFHFVPLSTLEIRNAMPGARITINGIDRGTVGESGSASVRIDAGPCRVELRLPKYVHHALDRQCPAGATTIVSDKDSLMTATFGFIEIPEVRPSHATITATRAGEPPRVLTIPTTELPVGKYTLRATAPGFADRIQPGIQVVAGRTTIFETWALDPAK